MNKNLNKVKEIVENLDVKKFNLLFSEDSDVFRNLKDEENENPLHWLAQVREFEANKEKLMAFQRISNKLIKLLEDEINDITKSGFTPLAMLCEPTYGNLNSDFAEKLILSGANVNVKNEVQKLLTPLHYAVLAGYSSEPVQKVLLENGADYTSKDDTNLTPLDYAIKSKTSDKFSSLLERLGKGKDLGLQLKESEANFYEEYLRSLVKTDPSQDKASEKTAMAYSTNNSRENPDFGVTSCYPGFVRDLITILSFEIMTTSQIVKKYEGLVSNSTDGKKIFIDFLKKLQTDRTKVEKQGNPSNNVLNNDLYKILSQPLIETHGAGAYGTKDYAKFYIKRWEQIESLLTKGADPNYNNGEFFKMAGLGSSIHSIDGIVASYLLFMAGGNPKNTDYSHMYSRSDMYPAIKGLINRQEKEMKVKNKTELDFYKAAIQGDIKKLKQLESKIPREINVNMGDEVFERTLLMSCADDGKYDVAKFLIKNKADVGIKDEVGNTAIHYAAKCGAVDFIDLLYFNSLDLMSKNTAGKTALSIASENNKYAFVCKLIKVLSIDKNSVQNNGTSMSNKFLETECEIKKIINNAIKKKDSKFLKILRNAIDDDKIFISDSEYLKSIIEGKDENEFLKFFKDTATDPNNFYIEEKPALIYYASKTNNDSVEFLLLTGVSPDCRDKNGDTLLHVIAKSKNHKLLKTFLENSIIKNLDDVNNNGKTPLDIALENNDMDYISIILNSDKYKCEFEKCLNKKIEDGLKNKNWSAVNTILISGFDYYEKHDNHKNNESKYCFKRRFPKDYPKDKSDTLTGNTLLLEALERGNTKLFESLLNIDANLNTIIDFNENSPLKVILNKKKLDFIEIIFKDEKFIKEITYELNESLLKSDYEKSSLILSSLDNYYSKNNKGDHDLGSVIEKVTEEGFLSNNLISLIDNALKYNCKVLQQCIEKKIQDYVNFEADYFTNLAWEAIINNKINVVSFLNKNGINFDLKSFDRSTPLHYCAKLNRVEMAKELLNCGVDLNAKNSNGKTPMEIAKGFGFIELNKFLQVEYEKQVSSGKIRRKMSFKRSFGRYFSRSEY